MPQKPGIDLNDTGNRIVAAIVLALVFIGGWWLIARSMTSGAMGSDETKDVQREVSTTTSDSNLTDVLGPIADDTPTIAGSRESVEVEDQVAGMIVKIKEATLAQVGWIAGRDAEGRTLGAGRFESGSYVDAEVPLLRATESGERYQVLIYVDDGDRAFDVHKDILVTHGDGSVAGSVFSAK